MSNQSKCKKYDINANELEVVDIAHPEEWQAHPQMVKDYIVAMRANSRQWSASTRNKAESNHSYKKPHAQKGTGNARQGSLSAPQYKGGGRVHTPRPKHDQHVRINQRERRKVIGALLIEKILAGDVVILKDDIKALFKVPKTAKVFNFLKTLGINGKSLFLGSSEALKEQESFRLSMRNIAKSSYVYLENVNGYDIMAHSKIILMDDSIEAFTQLLRGKND